MGASVAAITSVAVLLAGCAAEQESELERAQARVSAAQEALTEAQDQAELTTAEFCAGSTDYVLALDRYGDVLTAEAPTVGDVVTAGADLSEPRQEALDAGEAAQQARTDVADAQDELNEATAALAAIEASAAPAGEAIEPAPATPAAVVPVAPADAVARVKQADSDFTAVQEGITDEMLLSDAAEAFNAAAVALEMSWLRLVVDAGCLTDEQQVEAFAAAQLYTSALQQSLTDAGYDTGGVDGVYGPATVSAVEQLQSAHNLPVTGAVDKATNEALQRDLAAQGSTDAQADVASTAALQQTLHLVGYWDGPVDGQWTPELTDALVRLQTDLGVPPSGAVDAATIAAFTASITAMLAPESTPTAQPSGEPSPTP